MKFYSYDDIKNAANCREVAEQLLGLKLSREGRCAATWRGGDNPTAVSINEDGWYDHVKEEKGSAIDLVARVKFGGDVQRAQEALGNFYSLTPKMSTQKRLPGEAPKNAYERLLDEGFRETARYSYVDEHGEPRHQVVRLEHPEPDKHGHKRKEFLQARPGDRWGVSGVELVLYNLPAVLASTWMLIPEGEKDVDTLKALNLPATTNAGGAEKWLDTYDYVFEGKDVVILPDNDTKGKLHANTIASHAKGRAKSIRSITLSTLPKGDVTDWFNQEGGTFEKLRELITLAEPMEEAKIPPKKDRRRDTSPQNGQKGGRKTPNYEQVAREFLLCNSDKFRRPLLRHWQGKWFRFRCGFFHPTRSDDVRSQIMSFLQDKYAKDASKSTRENIMANLLSTEMCAVPSHVTIPSWLNGKQVHSAFGWLPFANALVNVPNLARSIGGEDIYHDDVFQKHSAALFTTYGLSYDFDAEAKCPHWLNFLAGVQPNEDDRRVLQMLAGLALIPETRWNVAFVFYGEGGTGKSVFLHVLQHLVGTENVCSLPLAQFGQRFSTWQLATHLVNVVGDLPTEGEGHSLRSVEGMFKDVCDGGMIPVEHKNQDPGTAPAIARCVFATNSLPRFADRSGAIWDRLRIIPFEQRFRGTGHENRNLRFEIVANELPGVFNWAVKGLALLQNQSSFPEHSGGGAAKEQHRRSCDPERIFLEEHYCIDKSNAHGEETRKAYGEFRDWLRDNGFDRRNETTFQDAVHRVFGVRKERIQVGGIRRMVYPGLRAC